jgi:hypothetical protein
MSDGGDVVATAGETRALQRAPASEIFNSDGNEKPCEPL